MNINLNSKKIINFINFVKKCHLPVIDCCFQINKNRILKHLNLNFVYLSFQIYDSSLLIIFQLSISHYKLKHLFFQISILFIKKHFKYFNLFK